LVLVAGSAFAALAAGTFHLELATSTGVDKAGLPADGSRWLEIHPNLDVAHLQTALTDNGDGELSIGDTIELDDSEFLVQWVGPTFHINCGTDPDRAFQPTVLPATGDPTGQFWSQVQPSFGALQQVDSWTDNGDLTLGPFDQVSVGGQSCGVLAALLTVVVEPGTVPNGQCAWGMLKAGY
jgi:hypothetical protein